MKNLYLKLACEGIRKNRKLYMPYLLSYTGMIMMFYIIAYLASSKVLACICRSGELNQIMYFGIWIVAIFAVIFLFYTNSFLMKKRKKEFGLYNVLGMGKRHLSLIIFYETLIVAFMTLVAGLFLGIIFSKLAEMIMISLLKGTAEYTMSVSLESIAITVIIFGVIFVLILINALRQVKFSTALALLNSESYGEKVPKSNWIIGVLGLIFLVAGYTLAVTVAGPSQALAFFFIAVILVILGTYLLMISGSVLLCRILKKNKKYYYKLNHFISVSSMMFRMKRNGAGLASICILSTMVLVTMSTFTCLYLGHNKAVDERYLREANYTFYMNDRDKLSEENTEDIKNTVDSYLTEEGGSSTDCIYFGYGMGYGLTIKGNTAFFPGEGYQVNENDITSYLYVFDIDDYNRINGTNISLADDELLLYEENLDLADDILKLGENEKEFKIKEKLENVPITNVVAEYNDTKVLCLVVSDITRVAAAEFDTSEAVFSDIEYRFAYSFDTQLPEDSQATALENVINKLDSGSFQKEHGVYFDLCTSTAEVKSSFRETYASLFFLGILLSIVFLFAAVLIIYYKQLSEGYEDRSRFEIMQKVGMTKKEIRKSINSQLLTIFYLPLIGAACHLAFAFPMISKMISLFGIKDSMFFAGITAICFVIFAIIYGVVYKATSGTYYKIVNSDMSE